MAERSRKFKWFSVFWALLIGGGLIVIAGAVILPSTKRARIDWDELRREDAAEQARLDADNATQPATTNATE